MNNNRIRVLLLAMFVASSAAAATNSLEAAIFSFPEVSADKYRADLAVECANTLIQAGKDRAYAALDAVVLAKEERFRGYDQKFLEERERMNQRACSLCRLIFVATNSGECLRPPRLGALALLPYESFLPPDWPDLPFVIVNDVPLSMCLGYNLAGRAERAANYLVYSKAYGTLRPTPFPSPTAIAVSNALTTLYSSPAWKGLNWSSEHYKLDEPYARKELWKQLANVANPTVQRTGASRSVDETNRTSEAAGSRR